MYTHVSILFIVPLKNELTFEINDRQASENIDKILIDCMSASLPYGAVYGSLSNMKKINFLRLPWFAWKFLWRVILRFFFVEKMLKLLIL